MNIREIELPGIGKKFETITNNGDKLVIIIHDDGRRDVYYFDQDNHEEATSSATFSDAEARQIAAIIGGMAYAPKALERIEMAFDELVIDWFKLDEGAKGIGKTIGELDIRKEYEVLIVAIIKHKQHKQIHTPGPETILEKGDTIVVSGKRNHVKEIGKEIFTGRGG